MIVKLTELYSFKHHRLAHISLLLPPLERSTQVVANDSTQRRNSHCNEDDADRVALAGASSGQLEEDSHSAAGSSKKTRTVPPKRYSCYRSYVTKKSRSQGGVRIEVPYGRMARSSLAKRLLIQSERLDFFTFSLFSQFLSWKPRISSMNETKTTNYR